MATSLTDAMGLPRPLAMAPKDYTPDILFQTPDGYRDAYYQYVFEQLFAVPPTLPQSLEAVPLIMEYDADFIAMSAHCATAAAQVGNGGNGPDFQVRWTNDSHRYLQSSMARALYVLGTEAEPDMLFPPVYYPAGGQAKFDIANLTVNNAQPQGGTIHVVLNGFKRFKDPYPDRPTANKLREGYRGITRDKEVVFKTTLGPLQVIDDAFTVVDKDADFIWRGFKIDVNPLPTPVAVPIYRIADDTGYRFSNIRKLDGLHPPFVANQANAIRCQYPEHVIPAGGRINIELQEIANGNQTLITMVFIGEKIYPTKHGIGFAE